MREYRASHPRYCQHVQCGRRIGPIVDNTERPTSCTTLDGCRHRRASPFQSQTVVINHHIKLIQENVLYLYQLYVRYNINLKKTFYASAGYTSRFILSVPLSRRLSRVNIGSPAGQPRWT